MARLLSAVVGHAKTKKSLESLLAEKNFFGGSIFAGPEGIGKKKTALAFLQELNCAKTPACGECEICRKLNSSDMSQFVHLIEPQNDRVKIEQVRDAIQFCSLQSWVPHRFILIDQIEKIMPQAANALLKSLEEPPVGVHFVFITSSLSQVLPTIRSRCQVVGFEALTFRDLAELCPELEEWQKIWCFGRLSLAQKIQKPEWLELRKLAINFLHNSSKIQKDLIEQFSEIDKVDFVIHCWLTYVRDALLFSGGGREGFYNSDIVPFIEKFSQKENLADLYDLIYNIRKDYVGHVDKNLIVENFSLDLNHV